MKVSELQGEELDYWVARAEGWEDDRLQDRQMKKKGIVHGTRFSNGYSYALVEPRPTTGMLLNSGAPFWSPSTMWHIAGPIIERERISLCPVMFGDGTPDGWSAFQTRVTGPMQSGNEPLIAAMRAYVASKFGDEVPTPHPKG